MALQKPNPLQYDHVSQDHQQDLLWPFSAHQTGRHRPGKSRLQKGKKDAADRIKDAEDNRAHPLLLPHMIKCIAVIVPDGILFFLPHDCALLS